jgi:RNA polymerase sigma-70 factor (ECF subfamily)
MQNFNNIYNENYKWVVNLIKSKTNNTPESEEMANDIFMKVYDNMSNFNPDKCKTGIVGWIRGFVFNKIIDFYRKKKNLMTSIENWKDEDGHEIYALTDSQDIEAEYCTKELVEKAKAIINVLPNPYKTVATLFYVKDFTYDEIETETGLSIGTIKGQLSRARTKMQIEFGVAI